MPRQFVTFCTTDELPPGEREVFDVGRTSILLFNIDGDYYAVENMCSHEEYELADGALDGCSLECSKHGAVFDVRTGAVLAPPAHKPIQIYTVRLQDNEVQVELDVQ